MNVLLATLLDKEWLLLGFSQIEEEVRLVDAHPRFEKLKIRVKATTTNDERKSS